MLWQLGDEDCILPSKLQAALQQILEEREAILRQDTGGTCESQYHRQYRSQVLFFIKAAPVFSLIQSTKSMIYLFIFSVWIFSSSSKCSHPGQQAELSSLVSEGFVRFFVEIVGHYPRHMVESSNGSKELQRDSFRKSHPSRGVRQFLQLFMDTQMFAGFIQDKELSKGGGRGHYEPLIISSTWGCLIGITFIVKSVLSVKLILNY